MNISFEKLKIGNECKGYILSWS